MSMVSNMETPMWTPGNDLAGYQKQFGEAVKAMESNGYIFPEDGRMHAALGLLSMGGNSTAVMALGPKGSGKSFFGDFAMGAENMITAENNDTGGSVVSQPNPIDNEQHIMGKLGERLDPEDPRVFIDEFPQMRNKGPLQSVMYGNTLMVAGQPVDMTRASRFVNGNYTDGVRNFETDAAGLSRFAMIAVSGDLTDDKEAALYNREQSPVNDRDVELKGVIPNAQIRADINQVLREAYPKSGEFGGTLSLVMRAIAKNPLLKLRELGVDGRASDSFLNTIRAMRLGGDFLHFDEGEANERSTINTLAIAQASALVLPTQVELSFVGVSKLSELWGDPDVPQLVQEIALRHALAGVGFEVYRLTREVPIENTKTTFTNFMERRVYSNPMDERQEEVVTKFRNRALMHAEKAIEELKSKQPKKEEAAGEDNGTATKRRWPLSRRNRS